MKVHRYAVMPSPIGELTLVADDLSLRAVWLGGPPTGADPDIRARAHADRDTLPDVLVLARSELEAYFAGTLRSFTVPVRAEGTAFQQRVWGALREIPFGATTSYGQVAARIGARGSARAVGAANGRNPLPIIVPCHRVIGASGRLVGYGGGLPRKTWLLEHETRRG